MILREKLIKPLFAPTNGSSNLPDSRRYRLHEHVSNLPRGCESWRNLLQKRCQFIFLIKWQRVLGYHSWLVIRWRIIILAVVSYHWYVILALALLFFLLFFYFLPQPCFNLTFFVLLPSQFIFHFLALAAFQIFQPLFLLEKLLLSLLNLLQLLLLLFDFFGVADKFILVSLNFLLFFLFFLFFLTFATFACNNSFEFKRRCYLTLHFYCWLDFFCFLDLSLFSFKFLNPLKYFLYLLNLLHHLLYLMYLLLLLLFYGLYWSFHIWKIFHLLQIINIRL